MFLILSAVFSVFLFIINPFGCFTRFIKFWKNYYKFSIPALASFIEDTLYSKYDQVSLYKQSSKVAVLTGGNRGIGVEVLKKLLACEITVVLGVRNPEAAKKAIENQLGELLQGSKVFYEKCDTGDLESVRKFAEIVQAKFSAVHLLINNAGIMYVPFEKTKDGFETQMAVNFLGHAFLTHCLLPLLIAGANTNDASHSRIVNVSSCAHKCGIIKYEDFNMEKNYDAGLQYGNSKLAQIMFSNHLDRICKEKGVKVQSHSVHPGVVDTGIFESTPIFKYMNIIRQLVLKTPERGSRTIVYAAISPEIEGEGGTYLSNCMKTKTSNFANDKTECEKLFKLTCELLKIKEFGAIGEKKLLF